MAQRLVVAAVDAFDVSRHTDAVVVAVLRELAEGLPPAWSGLPERLSALADSIEKGGDE